MKTRHASCSCGQLTVACTGDPVRVSICHCLACQRRTGSVFAAQARFPDENVSISGRATEYVRVADSGAEVRFYFCPTCGSTVYYRIDDWPGVTAVTVGAFADPAFSPPAHSVYEERKHAWVSVPEDVEHVP